MGNYLGGAQLALTFVPSTEFGVAEGLSGLEAALLLGDFAWCLNSERRWKGQVDTSGGNLEVITLCGFEQQSRRKGGGRTVESPFLGLLALRGKTISLDL